MGIRFACHACAKPLNIKTELAGKRGVCPQCGTRFRIPHSDTAQSIPLESPDARTLPAAAAPSYQTVETHEDAWGETTTPEIQENTVARENAQPDLVPTVAVASSPTQRVQTTSLLDDPDAVWYVRPPSGGQYGPASGDMLRTWIVEARVTGNSLIWRDGWAQWRTASDVLTEFGANDPLISSVGTSSTAVHANGTAHPNGMNHANGTVAHRSSASSHPMEPVATQTLTGDSSIGKVKSKRTGNRFVMIGTLAALSMTLIGVLIYLTQR